MFSLYKCTISSLYMVSFFSSHFLSTLVSKMSQRTKGFGSIEDCILCHAYILNTTDGEIGAYQTAAVMWSKIQNSYNHEAVDKHKLCPRTVKSLWSRWDKISPACTLYAACLASAEDHICSGGNEMDSVSAFDIHIKSYFFIYFEVY